MQAGDIDQLDGPAAANDALRILASVTMSENGEIGGAGWRILTEWNSIMKPATGHSRHATRGSTDASSSPSARQGSIAGRSVRRARRNARTLRSSPRRAPLDNQLLREENAPRLSNSDRRGPKRPCPWRRSPWLRDLTAAAGSTLRFRLSISAHLAN